jgi:serine/threonine protein kinase
MKLILGNRFLIQILYNSKIFQKPPTIFIFSYSFAQEGMLSQYYRNLESLLQKKGYIKEVEATALLYQIAKGLEYLYDKGILHRDIKTENILIS